MPPINNDPPHGTPHTRKGRTSSYEKHRRACPCPRSRSCLLLYADGDDGRVSEGQPRCLLQRRLSAALRPDDAEVRVSRLLRRPSHLLDVLFPAKAKKTRRGRGEGGGWATGKRKRSSPSPSPLLLLLFFSSSGPTRAVLKTPHNQQCRGHAHRRHSPKQRTKKKEKKKHEKSSSKQTTCT